MKRSIISTLSLVGGFAIACVGVLLVSFILISQRGTTIVETVRLISSEKSLNQEIAKEAFYYSPSGDHRNLSKAIEDFQTGLTSLKAGAEDDTERWLINKVAVKWDALNEALNKDAKYDIYKQNDALQLELNALYEHQFSKLIEYRSLRLYSLIFATIAIMIFCMIAVLTIRSIRLGFDRYLLKIKELLAHKERGGEIDKRELAKFIAPDADNEFAQIGHHLALVAHNVKDYESYAKDLTDLSDKIASQIGDLTVAAEDEIARSELSEDEKAKLSREVGLVEDSVIQACEELSASVHLLLRLKNSVPMFERIGGDSVKDG